MEYYLYPPFFIVPEESDFADAWESFCCKLLNVKEKTDEIYRRNPPEQGIDLFYPSKQIAYQCKSVESGRSGDFNVTNAIDSIKAAKLIQSDVGWKEYILCTNVDITGLAEKKLRNELPNIILKPKSYWQNACEEFNSLVERNFRLLLVVPYQRVINTINEAFYSNYSDKLKDMLENDSYEIFLYSNRYDKIYRVTVSSEFKIEDLLHILRRFFDLPKSKTITSENITVSLNHSIVYEGKKQIFSKSLRESGMHSGSIITYWTTLVWLDEAKKFNSDHIHLITADDFNNMQSPQQRSAKAMGLFREDIQTAFMKFDKSILTSDD
jgi:hypothetical protein